MNKKKIALLFGGLALVSYLSFTYFPFKTQDTPVLSLQEEESYMQVYLLDKENTLVPVSISVNPDTSIEDKLQLLIAYMSGKQKIDNFKPLFKKECILKTVSLQDHTAVLYFNESFKNYDKKQELRLLESLAWGVTQFSDITDVKLMLDNQELKEMPLDHTPIPATLNRQIGINHFETKASTLHDSHTITVFATRKIDGVVYMVPQSRRVPYDVNTMEEEIEQIVSDVQVSANLSQPLYDDNITLHSSHFENGVLSVDVKGNLLGSDREIKQDAYNCLILSLSMLEGVEELQVKVDGVILSPFENKNSISVNDLVYNEVRF